tara:strand:+ start:710 stop:1456 length:747 start_codon:yes stop_codon:yes gene_type:complete
MNRGFSLDRDILTLGGCWELQIGVNGYERFDGNSLVTQAAAGRYFEILHIPSFASCDSMNSARIMVRLLEDGYECWLQISEILGKAFLKDSWKSNLLSKAQIKDRIPTILEWLKKMSIIPNQYLWGGTIGPNFDCSGLVQSAFASEGIWLPRDAWQQEKFCTKVDFTLEKLQLLSPGDLIFFGTSDECDHVAIYLGDAKYCHSSGFSNGSNGIGINTFNEVDSISSYYQSRIRTAGRVECCHDGSKLI